MCAMLAGRGIIGSNRLNFLSSPHLCVGSKNFAADHCIAIVRHNSSAKRHQPISDTATVEALEMILDVSRYPLYIACPHGYEYSGKEFVQFIPLQ